MDEPRRLERERLVTCKTGEDRSDIALRIPASGRSRLNETVDVAALQARSFQEQFALSLTQVTAVGEIAILADPRFADAIANDGLWRPYDFLFKGKPGVYCEDCDVAAPTDPESRGARFAGVDAHACSDESAERLWAISEELLARA